MGSLYDALCDGGACTPVVQTAWQLERSAAATAYAPCTFTTLVGYEWTHEFSAGGAGHHNVIFASESVPDRRSAASML